MRVTNVDDPDGDVVLYTVKSNLQSAPHFQAVFPDSSRSRYIINTALINWLNSLETEFQNSSDPSDAAIIAHYVKHFSDDLVADGVITSGSAEYYGIWAQNVHGGANGVSQIINFIEDYIAVMTVVLTINSIVAIVQASNLAANSSLTLNNSQYISIANQVDDLTTTMTVRPSSSNVMLGTDYAGVTWYGRADQYGMSCFYSPNYNSLSAQYGDDIMQMSNFNYLAKAKFTNKTFFFSHDPMYYVQHPTVAQGYYAELEWLRKSYGISQYSSSNFQSIIQNGVQYWRLVP